MIAAGLLPDDVVQATRRIDATVDGAAGPLPPALRRAAPARQREFAAGRAAAAAALATLAGRTPLPLSDDDMVVAMAVGGAPRWPAGVAGSITHTRAVAWCAVADAARIAAVGIDLEPVVAPARVAAVQHAVTHPGELTGHRWPPAFDACTRLTLAFSAREALFKCLAPLSGRHFDYLDVEVVEVDVAGGSAVSGASGSIVLRLATSLTPAWPAGACVGVRFTLLDRHVATACTVAAAAGPELSARSGSASSAPAAS